MIQLQKGESNVKKMILLVSAFMLVLLLSACNGSSESFDPKVEQEKATEVMNSVLTSFEDQEKLAEAQTRDEANPIAWEKIKEKNNKVLSTELSEEDQERLLYVLTINKAETLDNGNSKSNLLFSQGAKINNVSFNETEEKFIFDIERLQIDHTLITLKREEGTWKIIAVQNPE